MEVKKTFIAGSKRYSPGDAAPEMDKPTQEHYLRYGMIGPKAEAKKPEQKKEAKPAENKAAKPQETK